MPEVAEEGEADRVGRRAVDRVGQSSRRPASARGRAAGASASSGGRPRSGWCRAPRPSPRPSRSSACLSASSPRDSTPSSLVTRILRPARPLAERPGVLAQGPRPAPGRATGQRLATLLVEVAPLGPGPLAGHVRLVGRAVGASLSARASVVVGSGARRRRLRLVGVAAVGWRRRPRSSSSSSSTSVGAARASARAGCGPVARRVPRAGVPPGRRPSGRPRSGAGTGRRTPTRRRRSGSRRSRPGCRRSATPISTEPRTTIGWMPTAPCMIRGWSTFMTTSQPAPIRMSAGSAAPAGGRARR